MRRRKAVAMAQAKIGRRVHEADAQHRFPGEEGRLPGSAGSDGHRSQDQIGAESHEALQRTGRGILCGAFQGGTHRHQCADPHSAVIAVDRRFPLCG